MREASLAELQGLPRDIGGDEVDLHLHEGLDGSRIINGPDVSHGYFFLLRFVWDDE